MGFFANTQEIAQRFGKYIAEFQELFRTNDVGFGSPEEFFRLAPRLARDETFREGITALTRSVQGQEEGRLSLTDMLTIIAIASGGEGIDTDGEAGMVPVSLLVVFLAGIGGWSGGEQEEAAIKDATGALNGKGGVEARQDDEKAAEELQQRLTAEPEEDIGKLTTTLFAGPAQVQEALGRLEMNTLQMKMHLDSIDSRIERIEPHLDDLKSRSAAAPEESRKDEEPTVPAAPIKPWPRPEEEAPRSEWMASAPPMKPWPSEKEEDLSWRGSAEETRPPVRANRTVKETEPVWREPLRDNGQRDSGQRAEIPMGRRTLAEGAASLRTANTAAANGQMERDYDEDLPIRVPFHEYLYAEEEPQWGRRLAGALAVVVIVLFISGAMFYRSHGWHGYDDAVHTVGSALANKKAALAGWFTSQRAQPASATSATGSAGAPSPAGSSSATSSQVNQGAAAPASGGIAERQAPDALPAAQTAPADAASPAQSDSGTAAVLKRNQAGATPAPAAASTPPAAQAANSTTGQREPGAGAAGLAARPAMHGEVAVIAGSGVSPQDMSEVNLKHGYHSTVPVFVDEARLSAVSEPRPEYPRDALAQGITGDVVVQANIGRNGEVESAQIVSGPAGLLKSSLDAVRQWRFMPYRVNGEPVEARTYVRFRYDSGR